MSFGIPELTNFRSSYSRQGLATLKSRVPDSIPATDGDYHLAVNLRTTLAALDSIARLDLSRLEDDCGVSVDSQHPLITEDVDPSNFNPRIQAQLEQNINNAFRAYNCAIASVNILNGRDGGGVNNPELAKVFSATGRFLQRELEPLLSPEQKRALGDTYFKPLHSVVINDHLSFLEFRPPGLSLAEAYYEHNDLLDKDFLQEFYRRMGDYYREELLPQILDQGVDPPSRIVLYCSGASTACAFEYIKGKDGAPPNEAFNVRFQEQFLDKLYSIGLDLLAKRGLQISGDEAVKAGLFRVSLVAISSDYLLHCEQRAAQIKTSLKEYNLLNILKRIHIKNLQLNLQNYLSNQLYQSLFRSIDFEIRSLIKELKRGALLSQEYKGVAQRIKRGISLIDRIVDGHPSKHTLEPDFRRVIDRYKKVNASLKLFADKFLGKDESATASLADATLDRLFTYINVNGVTRFYGYNEEEIVDQLSQLRTDETDLSSANKAFHQLFAKAVSLIVSQMLFNVDPLDFKNISGIHANIETDINSEGEAAPRIALYYSFRKDNDEEYAEYFRRRYSEAIDEAIDEAAEIFKDNVDQILHLDWTALERYTTIPINLGLDLSGLRLQSSTAEFSSN